MPGSARTVLVTGAASGIGAAIAALLASRGMEVIVADESDRVKSVADRIGARVLEFDVSDESAVDAALAGIEKLDVLVNSAGIATETRIDDADLAVYRRTLDVNLTGAMLVTRACLPMLRRSSSARVLNIGSVQGFASAESVLAYSTAKAAIHGMTRSLAVDLAPDGILVNALAPGFIDTPMSVLADGTSEYDTDWFRSVYIEHGRIPLRRPASPDEVAAAAEFLVSEHNTYVTGAVLPVDGGLTATF
jgi:NAD(P)-dependent dehydrogenase (short-subunit alcohol dehydrogenase family)